MPNTEIERKFLVQNDSYRQLASHQYEILQGYLCKEPGRTVRVRVRDARAFLTIKAAAPAGSIARFEWEKEIDMSDAKALLQHCLPGVIDKTRYIVQAENGLKWEIDEFHGRLAGLTLAEIELQDEQQSFVKPAFIGVEVTNDPRYYNSNM